MNDNIQKIFNHLRKTVPELTLHNGFGHCAYGSKLLHEELKKNNIPSKIIVINNLKGNKDTEPMKLAVDDLLNDVDITDPLFGVIKDMYVKRGNKLPKNAGHAVVLVGDIVWDITSEQFGLPNTYPFSDLFKWWDKVTVSDIKLNKEQLDFYIEKVTTLEIIKGYDEYRDKMIATESIKPKYLKW